MIIYHPIIVTIITVTIAVQSKLKVINCNNGFDSCHRYQCNGSQLMNPDISGAIFTVSLFTYIQFSMCRGRQICQGSLIDPD